MSSTTIKCPPHVFLTGVTGFVVGSILDSLYIAHPNIHVTALVRSGSDARLLRAAYSNFKCILGTLSMLPFIKSCAAGADFVIHASGDNIPAVSTMIDGLASSPNVEPNAPRLISISGPRSLVDRSLPVTGVASADSRIWSEVTDAREILSLPKERMHADTDQAIVAQSIANGVGSILVSPGQQWGRGRGLLKQESHAATYYSAVKKRGGAFVIGDGSIGPGLQYVA